MKSSRSARVRMACLAAMSMSLPACAVFEEPMPGAFDGGADSGIDAGDVGFDAGADDAGPPDAGPSDAGRGDAGIVRRPPLESCGFGASTTVTTVNDPALNEVSGIAASRRHPRVFWMIEDSGSAAVVHAVNDLGETIGTYRVAGAAVDYEDVAIGPGPEAGRDYLYVADIGDNDGSRANIVVYRALEPDVTFDQPRETGMLERVEPLPMTFPAGAGDNAEALIVDPATQDIYIISKNGFSRPNNLFRLAAPHTAAVSRELQLLGPLFAGDGTDIAITSASISPDGNHIVTRGLRAVNYWRRPAGMSIRDTLLTRLPCDAPYGVGDKGESISLLNDSYFSLSEGTAQPLERVSLTR